MNRFDSIYPATIKKYIAENRLCEIEIEGITEGASELPLAEILYPIGDKQDDTELEILEGDRVWVSFINNDPRYPIITGSRATNEGNFTDTRHYHHKNIRFDADEKIESFVLGDCEITMLTDSITLRVGASSIKLTEASLTSLISGNTTTISSDGTTTDKKINTDQGITATSDIKSSADVKAGSISLKNHKHWHGNSYTDNPT